MDSQQKHMRAKKLLKQNKWKSYQKEKQAQMVLKCVMLINGEIYSHDKSEVAILHCFAIDDSKDPNFCRGGEGSCSAAIPASMPQTTSPTQQQPRELSTSTVTEGFCWVVTKSE